MLTNPDFITFCNTEIRPFADKISTVYYSAQRVVDLMNSKGIPALCVAASGDFIGDGAPIDGRTQINANDVLNLYGVANWIVYNVSTPPSGSSITIKSQVLKVAVNPTL